MGPNDMISRKRKAPPTFTQDINIFDNDVHVTHSDPHVDVCSPLRVSLKISQNIRYSLYDAHILWLRSSATANLSFGKGKQALLPTLHFPTRKKLAFESASYLWTCDT